LTLTIYKNKLQKSRPNRPVRAEDSVSDILMTIRNGMPHLKKAERRVAECILQDPVSVMEKNITALAHDASTSEATVVRFCNRIGLKGYIDLRLNLALELPPVESPNEHVRVEDSPFQILHKMMKAAKCAFDDSLGNLDGTAFEASVNVLSEADRIDFYGTGKSIFIAQLAHHKFFRYGVPCTAYTQSHMQAMSALMLSQDSAAVVISATGVTKSTIEKAKIAKESGATVIGITGPENSKLGRQCDIVLPVHSKEAAVWFAPQTTRLVQIGILDALFVAVTIRKYGTLGKDLEDVGSRSGQTDTPQSG
jgi:RpiR family carbohydrate utilization transcriptional regulator